VKNILGQLTRICASATYCSKLSKSVGSPRDGGLYLQPPGTNTVFPAKEPRYFRNACNVVSAAKGNDAASPNDRDLGLSATKESAHLAYSLHDPRLGSVLK